jgi:hypothetical protein
VYTNKLNCRINNITLICRIVSELIITERTYVENKSKYDVTSGVASVCFLLCDIIKDCAHAVIKQTENLSNSCFDHSSAKLMYKFWMAKNLLHQMQII